MLDGLARCWDALGQERNKEPFLVLDMRSEQCLEAEQAAPELRKRFARVYGIKGRLIFTQARNQFPGLLVVETGRARRPGCSAPRVDFRIEPRLFPRDMWFEGVVQPTEDAKQMGGKLGQYPRVDLAGDLVNLVEAPDEIAVFMLGERPHRLGRGCHVGHLQTPRAGDRTEWDPSRVSNDRCPRLSETGAKVIRATGRSARTRRAPGPLHGAFTRNSGSGTSPATHDTSRSPAPRDATGIAPAKGVILKKRP